MSLGRQLFVAYSTVYPVGYISLHCHALPRTTRDSVWPSSSLRHLGFHWTCPLTAREGTDYPVARPLWSCLVLCPALFTAPLGSLVGSLVIGLEGHGFLRVPLATWLGLDDVLHVVPNSS